MVVHNCKQMQLNLQVNCSEDFKCILILKECVVTYRKSIAFYCVAEKRFMFHLPIFAYYITKNEQLIGSCDILLFDKIKEQNNTIAEAVWMVSH